MECNHTTIEKCHYTYVTIYDSINETVCKENYEKVCQLTTVKQPINETVLRCHKPLIKTCETESIQTDDPGVEQICQTVYESACSTKYKDIPTGPIGTKSKIQGGQTMLWYLHACCPSFELVSAQI